MPKISYKNSDTDDSADSDTSRSEESDEDSATCRSKFLLMYKYKLRDFMIICYSVIHIWD